MSTSIIYALSSNSPSFSDRILLRLYCINRMRPAIKIIKQLPDDHLLALDKPMITMGRLYEEKSVLQLWKDVKQYKYVYDMEFLPYVFHRVFLVLAQGKKIVYDELPRDFDEINVEEFLSAIDVVVHHVIHINQHYHNSGLSFNDWIKQYWWIPSLFIASIFIKVLKYYYLDSKNDFI